MEKLIMCRICLSRTDKNVSVFSEKTIWDTKVKLSDMIMACAPVEIKINDDLPRYICDLCFRHLQIAFLFRIRALQADKTLRHCVREKLDPPTKLLSEIFPLTSIADEFDTLCFTLDEMLKMMEENCSGGNVVSKVKENINSLEELEKSIKTEKVEVVEPKNVQDEQPQQQQPEQQQQLQLAQQLQLQQQVPQQQQQQQIQVDYQSLLQPVLNSNSSLVTGSLLPPEVQLPKPYLMPNIIIPSNANTLAPIVLQQNCPVDIGNVLSGNIQPGTDSKPKPTEYNKMYILIPINKNDPQAQAQVKPNMVSNSVLTSTTRTNTTQTESVALKTVSINKPTASSVDKQANSAEKIKAQTQNLGNNKVNQETSDLTMVESFFEGTGEHEICTKMVEGHRKGRKCYTNMKNVADPDASSSRPSKKPKQVSGSSSAKPSASVSSTPDSKKLLDYIVID